MHDDGKLRLRSLPDLLAEADAGLLRELVASLAASRGALAQEALDFLSARLGPGLGGDGDAATEEVDRLWTAMKKELRRLSDDGDVEEGEVDFAGSRLGDLAQRARELTRPARRALLSEVLPFIRDDEIGLYDPLSELAFAICQDADDLLRLAKAFESFGNLQADHQAMGTYRRLGDRENYLRLRRRYLTTGSDYWDLVSFLEESGDHAQAVEIAKQGIARASGGLDQLWGFYGSELKRMGDRQGYLAFEFKRLAHNPCVDRYRAFLEICSPDEWADYEPRFLAALAEERPRTRLSLHIERHEYEAAVADLGQVELPSSLDLRDPVLAGARELERRFPHDVLAFYRKTLGRIDAPGSRAEYARRASICRVLRHMWVDVLETPDEWLQFARQVKAHNARKTAMQEELSRVIRDWVDL